jgi:acetolactate decarboxylase
VTCGITPLAPVAVASSMSAVRSPALHDTSIRGLNAYKQAPLRNARYPLQSSTAISALAHFDGLDGEMVGVDGRFFQVRSDGTVALASNDAMTPFAVVTNFKPDQSIAIRGPASMAQLTTALDQMLPSRNYFYAVKIHGQFSFVTARSVSRQVKPYPTLAQAIAQQSIFPLHNVRGTLVRFRSPAFEKGINQPGYHFHFISEDEKSGGHALDFDICDAIAEIQTIRRHSKVLPDDEQFREASLPLQQLEVWSRQGP